MATPAIPAAALASLYTSAQALSGIAPLAAPSVFIPSDQIHPSAAFSAAAPRYPKLFEEAKASEEKKVAAGTVAVKQAVDPLIFDILVSNELNRQLKKKFGMAFLIITCFFTISSYVIVVLAAIYEWKIPASAMTALIIQAPLQMIGILYIMAKNLFSTAPIEPNTKKN
jgi:hypothetical protein